MRLSDGVGIRNVDPSPGGRRRTACPVAGVYHPAVMAAARKWGQHWLANDELAQALVELIGARPGDRFLEIGPGRGRLTRALLRHPVEVVAVEIDPECCRRLEDLRAAVDGGAADTGGSLHPGCSLEVIQGDILEMVIADLGVDTPVRVAGNLPYNVSSPILRWTVRQRRHVEDAHYMLSADVARRALAPPDDPERSLLSVRLQWHFEGRLLKKLGPGAFRPPPGVDSGFVRLRPRTPPACEASEVHLRTVLSAAFAHRRKTLSRSLRLAGWDAAVVDDALADAGIPGRARAQEVELDRLAALAAALPERAA